MKALVKSYTIQLVNNYLFFIRIKYLHENRSFSWILSVFERNKPFLNVFF